MLAESVADRLLHSPSKAAAGYFAYFYGLCKETAKESIRLLTTEAGHDLIVLESQP